MPYGTCQHHLHVLEQNDMIIKKRDGIKVRYYPYSTPEWIQPGGSTSQKIMVLVHNEPGLSQKQIGERLGLAKNTVSYNINKLMQERKIAIGAPPSRCRLAMSWSLRMGAVAPGKRTRSKNLRCP